MDKVELAELEASLLGGYDIGQEPSLALIAHIRELENVIANGWPDRIATHRHRDAETRIERKDKQLASKVEEVVELLTGLCVANKTIKRDKACIAALAEYMQSCSSRRTLVSPLAAATIIANHSAPKCGNPDCKDGYVYDSGGLNAAGDPEPPELVKCPDCQPKCGNPDCDNGYIFGTTDADKHHGDPCLDCQPKCKTCGGEVGKVSGRCMKCNPPRCACGATLGLPTFADVLGIYNRTEPLERKCKACLEIPLPDTEYIAKQRADYPNEESE